MLACKKVELFVVTIAFFSFFLIPTHFITNASADVKNENIKTSVSKTLSTTADADTYVDTVSPTSNFGGQTDLVAGLSSSNLYAAFIHFNFSTEPQNVTKARIKFYVWSVGSTVNLSATIITTPWSEYSMTWMNKPSGKTHIAYIIIPSSGFYYIDITNYLAGRNNISICLNCSNYLNTDTAWIDSREWYSYNSQEVPMIEWTYTATSSTPPTSPMPFMPGFPVDITLLGLGIGIVGIVAITSRKRRGETTNL